VEFDFFLLSALKLGEDFEYLKRELQPLERFKILIGNPLVVNKLILQTSKDA